MGLIESRSSTMNLKRRFLLVEILKPGGDKLSEFPEGSSGFRESYVGASGLTETERKLIDQTYRSADPPLSPISPHDRLS
jgi:hypothetical protein